MAVAVFISATVSASMHPGEDELDLAILKDGGAPVHYHLRRDSSMPDPVAFDASFMTELGSVWKLFVHFYLNEKQIRPPRYVCKGEDKEELFCCKPKGDIDMDEALSKSCGPYFSPNRLSIADAEWRGFWQEKAKLHFGWLVDLAKLRPGTLVPVLELLRALDVLKRFPESYRKTSDVLARVVIDGTARGSVKSLGSTLRVKTFTWDHPENKARYVGGFAGWLSDGSSIWGRGAGTSGQIMKKWSEKIAKIPTSRPQGGSRECVRVEFFERYPIQALLELPSMKAATEGPMNGRFRVLFSNGNSLEVASKDQLRYGTTQDGSGRISGTFGVNEYVARVIDREINRTPVEAARAFGIVIRTYLHQNAKRSEGCLSIADSTRTQRVSPNPPSESASRIADWSDRMVLTGVPIVRYHATRGGQNLLSWARAREMAESGSHFNEILKSAYPNMRLGFEAGNSEVACRRLREAESWIQRQSRNWLPSLSEISGFQLPEGFKVCRSASGQPFTDSENNIIYMNYSGDLEDQVTAAHEYLHLAFKYRPEGLNESFIEARARELVLLQGQAGEYETR